MGTLNMIQLESAAVSFSKPQANKPFQVLLKRKFFFSRAELKGYFRPSHSQEASKPSKDSYHDLDYSSATTSSYDAECKHSVAISTDPCLEPDLFNCSKPQFECETKESLFIYGIHEPHVPVSYTHLTLPTICSV
eukprot:TRINITY_DN7626_c0_g3_i1.p1 TRINITY_DN7626_c0_g3~~TRINITY_DN7626_c0_g3_i1.p1  ORF type:complete len:135 (-),score=14.01 TRINITY_DN7626_c0_g3_i1:35-439(-)